MSLDPQVKAVLELVESAAAPEYCDLTPAEARAQHEAKAHVLDVGALPVVSREDRRVPGAAGTVPVRIYRPRISAAPLPVLVWLHGGGHVVGSVATYDALCTHLAVGADCLVVSVEYRLAPEHPFPAAVEDSFAALAWTGAEIGALGGDPTRIAVAGDSAGGNLAAVCAILARDLGAPALAMQLLIYPATAPMPDSASHHDFAEGLLLTRRTIDWFQDHYAGEPANRSDWRFAPLLAEDLAGLPPALVMVAGHDPLRDEGIAYAERLGAAGNEVELINYEGMIHAFVSLAGAVDVGREAIDRAAAALAVALRAR